ncbi:glucosamine kinase GspK [Oceanobacillus picturae]|uniref:Glucosamine kinase GspK n=1 Tax=Oceanobacillus picturae TaxID=171693 RepID=A0A0U9H7T7_9BACI|nr:BadF/BadG/BcrA/BcrD ATPase family protein [Oceanobacillus picturae]GAQ16196.1 glucosamine kinase GspK [Oceanobacillus picturae]
MAYYIGIDGGGTKTNAVLADEKGNILSQAISGASNPNAVGEQELSQVFQTLFLKLDNEGKTPLKNVKWVYAGIAGSANPANRTLLESILSKLLPHATVFVEPDAVCALYSGTYGGAGIVQIAGTGSITYGMNEAGDQGRVGGWGYLFGDEGSGYAIGRAGVTEALKSVDGRGEPTILLEMLYEHFQVSQAQELIKKVYNAKQPKTIIAPLSRIVFQAYGQEDVVAQAILQQAAKDITSQIMALYRTLFTGDEKTEVVLCGGVFQEKAVMPVLLKNYLENIPLTLVQPEFPPVAGSLIGAYKQATIQVSRNMLEQIKNTQ